MISWAKLGSSIPVERVPEEFTLLTWTSDGGPQALFPRRDAPLFGRRHKRPRGPRLPVIAVTGFLGAGKTTLIRSLLGTPEGVNTAVVVNEYGEVGIDHALLRSSSDVAVLLGNGCLCCNVRTDLQVTLRGLFADRARGAVPSFERVIIETSGLADPGPVLQTFATDRALGREFHLQALVTVIDAINGETNIERMPEARKQAALADRIVVTKSDLADNARTGRLLNRLAALSSAPVAIAANGAIAPSVLLDELPPPRRRFDLGEDAAHTHGLLSFSLIFEEPLSWPAFDQTIAVLTALRGPDVLRIKGLLAVEEFRGPVVVHIVQHVAHPPVELEDWPDDDRRSRLVFVTRGLPREPVVHLFSAVAAVVASAGA
jgi:G3E family GTPase